MTDNINVKPGKGGTAVPVATDNVDGIHFPVYKLAIGGDGEAVLIDTDNPLYVQLPSLTYETDTVTMLNEISKKLSILIKYEAMLHKIDLEEDL